MLSPLNWPEEVTMRELRDKEDKHEWHKEQGTVIENATKFSIDYLCCVDDFDEMVLKGEACRKHPFSFCEDGNCEACFEEHETPINFGVVGMDDYE